MKKEKIYLVDISSFIFRAFFAIRSLSTSKGLPVNAVYGVITMLLNLIEKNKPEYVLCVFDTPAPTFRKKMYEEYKSNRGEPPDELKPQFELIRKAVLALGIPRVWAEGFEADDLIGSLAAKFTDRDVVIVTSDKDLMQLVSERVSVLDTMKNVLYTEKEVVEKLGVPPKFVTDYLGLIGDSSDNIPGVDGIGPKTAVELIQTFGSLEQILKSTAEIKSPKRRETLEKQADLAKLSKELATIKCDLNDEIKDIKLSEIKFKYEFGPEFFAFLDEMEFKALKLKYQTAQGLAEVPHSAEAVKESEPGKGKAEAKQAETKEVAALGDVFLELSKDEPLAMEFSLASPKWSELAVVAFKLQSVSRSYSHKGEFTRQDFESFFNQAAVKETRVYAFDIKPFLKTALKLGCAWESVYRFAAKSGFDLMLAHYLLEPEDKHELDKILSAFDTGGLGMLKVDFDLWLKAGSGFAKRLEDEKLDGLFRSMEMPLAAVLAKIENNGVKVDQDILSVLSKEYEQEVREIEKSIFETVGTTFNLNSPKQLSQILFEQLKLPVISKTKTGYSTDAEVLGKLAKLHPVPAQIVRYRELTKLKSTYIDVLPGLIDSDGRIHAQFNQAVAATGRLSGSDPNLQNIPIKTLSGRKIRKAFVAENGSILVGADYSQIELRIVAELSGDARLIRAFEEGKDIHRATAAEIFHVKPEDVTDSQRATAKAINFGLIYGKSAFGLATELNISRTEAQNYITAYFTKYSGVKAFMDKCIADARREKSSFTFFGRRRQIRDIDNKNMAVRSNAERMAMNTPVQGTAADIIKLAMLKVCESAEKLNAKFILSVHDELVLEVPLAKQKEAEKLLKQDMESVSDMFKVKLQAEAEAADNWMDL